MTPEYRKTVLDILTTALKGNKDAVSYCLNLYEVAHVWDDLIDKDKEITDAAIHTAFIRCLVDIPYNSFYRQNIDYLLPLQHNSILQWIDANKMEKMDLQSKYKAYMLKASFLQIVNCCAALIGGHEWAMEIGADLRNALYAETLEEFLNEVQYA